MNKIELYKAVNQAGLRNKNSAYTDMSLDQFATDPVVVEAHYDDLMGFLEAWDHMKFPSIIDIRKALKIANAKRYQALVKDAAKEKSCPKCHLGHIFVDKRVAEYQNLITYSYRCDCPLGDRLKNIPPFRFD